MKEAKRKIRLMGTVIDLSVTHGSPEVILDRVVGLLKMYEQRFSANDPSSELSEVNNNSGLRPVKVHTELFDLISIGKKHSLPANSHLNIAIGPLVQAWRIGFADAREPSPEEIEELLKIIDLDQVLLKENTVYLKRRGMAIDLGALAKGYIADRIIDFLCSENVHSALINLGGNLVTMGPALQHTDRFWRIGIQNPTHSRGTSQIVLRVRDQSVVTSGIYERQYSKNGKTFHHILNPKTGYPIETDVVSLTILSNRSIDGEIWTTRLFGKPTEEIIYEINQLPHIEGLVINNKGKIHYSNGMNDFIL
ncbi:MAG TPA: FAD:protein FMN transferase [Atopostipes sp.]|nr:FAD:protein FMN transferase [Atopostipes sp.]